MKRQHIHLAQGVPGDKVISGTAHFHSYPPLYLTKKLVTPGMRKSSQILIYIDLPKALDAGIKFYLSSNGVVLTEGDERGFLSPEFFLRVENAAAQSVAFTTAAADTDAPTAPTASSSSTTTTIATESSSDALVEEVAGMQVQQ
jgi:2'-phosphotransferase